MSAGRNLPLSGERLWSSLMEMARIGALPNGGCDRQALTDEDAAYDIIMASSSNGMAMSPSWLIQPVNVVP